MVAVNAYARAADAPDASTSLLLPFTLMSLHDEWQDGRRHFSQQSMARLLHRDGPALLTNPLTEGLVA
jgi:hypothetical protein